MSRYAQIVINNSKVSAEQHKKFGYSKNNIVIIPNGFDTKIFKPDLEARMQLREEFGLSEENILIGLVARYHPQKDHPGFLKAAAIIKKNNPRCRFLLAGRNVDDSNKDIKIMINTLDLVDEVCL